MKNLEGFTQRYNYLLEQKGRNLVIASCRHEHVGDPLQAADSFMSSLGYQPLGSKWFDLNQVSRESEGIKFGDYAGHLAKTLERNLDNSEDWFPAVLIPVAIAIFIIGCLLIYYFIIEP